MTPENRSKEQHLTLLCLESAGSGCSVAISRNGRMLSEKALDFRHGHAEKLVPLIEAAMQEAQCTWADLDAVVTTRGPGSFTGVRVGLATARGLAFAAKVPLLAFSVFEVLAHKTPQAAHTGTSLVIAVDSRRQEPFIQIFDGVDKTPLSPPLCVLPQDSVRLIPEGQLLLAGDAQALIFNAIEKTRKQDIILQQGPSKISAADLCAMVTKDQLYQSPPATASPLYIRPPDAIPSPGG